MESDNTTGMRFFYLFFDLFLLNIAFFLVLTFSPLHNILDSTERSLYFLHANISEMIAYLVYSKRNYYFRDRFRERLKYISFRFLVLIGVLYILAEMFFPINYLRIFLIEYVLVFFMIKTSVFFVIYKFYQHRYKKGSSLNRVVILGQNDTSAILGNLFNNSFRLGFKLVGYISDTDKCDKNKILGNLEELPSLAKTHNLNMIFVTIPEYFGVNNTKEILALCNRIGLRVRYVLTNQYWNQHTQRNVESINYFKIFNPQEIPLDKLTLRFTKRIFDVVFSSLVILLIFSWLFPILGIIIKLNSKGPIFFLQQRTGINNKTFQCIKFRTMKVNNDSDTKQATVGDDRITSIGKFLRKYNIDELPQFFNVLVGNMSVVGPRPHMLKHTEQYSALIDHYKVRHFVKPGITGWAQVNGYRGLTDELWKMEKRVDYDMQYLEKWYFWWDIKIIFMTLFNKESFRNAM